MNLKTYMNSDSQKAMNHRALEIKRSEPKFLEMDLDYSEDRYITINANDISAFWEDEDDDDYTFILMNSGKKFRVEEEYDDVKSFLRHMDIDIEND